MKRFYWFLFLVFMMFFMASNTALAAGHGRERPMKKGILLVAFGTSVSEAQVAFQNIEKRVRAAFPAIPVRWAYTSHIIRHKLAKEGKILDSVEVALAKMMDEGYTHVGVQSLHTIPGEEFHDLRRNAHLFEEMAGGFGRVLVGYPLLATEKDMERVIQALLENIPGERKAADGVVFMGHGTPHPSNVFYTALLYHLQKKDPNVFVGTVEGAPGIEEIQEMLKAKDIKRVFLTPFMSVAGDHARNDMAGDEPDSWKSILQRAGLVCVPVLKGTAEYDNMVGIWVDHLREVMAHFK